MLRFVYNYSLMLKKHVSSAIVVTKAFDLSAVGALLIISGVWFFKENLASEIYLILAY